MSPYTLYRHLQAVILQRWKEWWWRWWWRLWWF